METQQKLLEGTWQFCLRRRKYDWYEIDIDRMKQVNVKSKLERDIRLVMFHKKLTMFDAPDRCPICDNDGSCCDIWTHAKAAETLLSQEGAVGYPSRLETHWEFEEEMSGGWQAMTPHLTKGLEAAVASGQFELQLSHTYVSPATGKWKTTIYDFDLQAMTQISGCSKKDRRIRRVQLYIVSPDAAELQDEIHAPMMRRSYTTSFG